MCPMSSEHSESNGQFEARLWQIASHWRSGPLYDLPCALALLICLRWAEFIDTERAAQATSEDGHRKPLLAPAHHWSALCNLKEDELVEVLTERLTHAIEANSSDRVSQFAVRLRQMSDPFRYLKHLLPSPRDLSNLVDCLAAQPFETLADRRNLLDSFDRILDFCSGKNFGEHRTPKPIADLMVALAQPRSGEEVYDPCFGTAGLLTAAIDYARRNNGEEAVPRSGTPVSVSGIEINNESYLIGLARLLLSGADEPAIELGNSLERDAPGSLRFEACDIVIANPPWGLRIHPERYQHRYEVLTSDSVGLFVQHALKRLRRGGRAVIVVPQNFLFQAGADQRLRQMLIERHSVNAIISLPQGAFLPYAGIKASILVLGRAGPTQRIRMVDASSDWEKIKGKGHSADECIRQIVSLTYSEVSSPDAWDIDAASTAKTGWDISVRRRDYVSLESCLRQLATDDIKLAMLEECCDVYIGRAVPRHDLLDEPDQSSKIPFIRVRDLGRHGVSRGTSWFSQEAPESTFSRTLISGDVLLSKSGTIGKVAVVRDGAVGGVASQGLFVLRPKDESVLPDYLVAYLSSVDVRNWLKDRARGSTIQHLTREALSALSVAIPPLETQYRLAMEFSDQGTDALQYMNYLSTGSQGDPILHWVEKWITKLELDSGRDGIPINLSELDSFATDKSLRVRVAVPIRPADAPEEWAKVPSMGDDTLVEWVKALPFHILRGISKVPPGPALYSLLREGADALETSRSNLKNRHPGAGRARLLVRALSDRLRTRARQMMLAGELALKDITQTLGPNRTVELGVTVHNTSPLPFREIEFSTKPDWGSPTISYLAEGGAANIKLSGDARAQDLMLRWTATNLDGATVTGEVEIPVAFPDEPLGSGGEESDLGSSPYIVGQIVMPERDDVFFGRQEILDAIRREVERSGNVILLEGNRRAGKTSILYHLKGADRIPGWLAVYSSLQSAKSSSDGELYRCFSEDIAKQLTELDIDVPLPDGSILPAGKRLGIRAAACRGISEEDPFHDFRDYLETVLALLGGRRLGLLLMLDEFDKLEEGVESGVTSKQVPENIRSLIQTIPKFSAILTGSRRLRQMREEYWSVLYGLGRRFGVSELSEQAARDLVTKPVEGKLAFSGEAVTRAINLVARQPYLLQCLCSRIFERAVTTRTRSITSSFVEQAADDFVQDNEHFAYLWDYVEYDRRRLILCICHHGIDGPDPLRIGVIEDRLQQLGVETITDVIAKDLEFLQELEIVSREGDALTGTYALAIPLMGVWIDRHKDVDVVAVRARDEG